MSFNSAYSNSWTYFIIGFFFIALGVAFVLLPLLASNGALSDLKVPSIILYMYNKGGFYFATSPILIILSVLSFLVFLLRR
ncbi:MAG: hypothetical protein ACRECH_15740 [Nitrososphaerales archaeon]